MSGSENKISPDIRTQSDDELSLLDLVRFVRRHGVIILGSTLMGGVLGLAVAFSLPAQWEASALIRVGQLGRSVSAESTVESLSRVVDRLMQKSFKGDALKRIGISPNESDPQVDLLLNSLKVRIEKSDLVSVRVRGTTPEDAMRFVDALTMGLVETHTKMMGPTIQRWHDNVDEIDMELLRLNSEIERLSGLLEKLPRGFSAANFSQVLLLNNTLLTSEAESRKLRESRHILQEQLSPEKTFLTSSLNQTEISTRPVFPQKHLFAAAGLVIGLFIGVLVSLLKAYVFVDKKD